MKVFVPRHISGGMFDMSVPIWPVSVSIIQLFILAVWAAIALAVWNQLVEAGASNIIAWILAAPIFFIFLFIAFFNISELNLPAFITKMIRTYFLDEPKKYQLNAKEVDNMQVKIKRLKAKQPDQKPEVKKTNIDRSQLDKLDNL